MDLLVTVLAFLFAVQSWLLVATQRRVLRLERAQVGTDHSHPLYEPTPLPLPGSIDLAPLQLELGHLDSQLRWLQRIHPHDSPHLYPPSALHPIAQSAPTTTTTRSILAKLKRRLTHD